MTTAVLKNTVATSFLKNINFGIRRKLPIVYQTESAECGLACIAMILAFHGQHVDLPELRRRSGMSSKGSRLSDLSKIAERLSLTSRAVRVDVKELGLLRLPCVLHWDLNHFVVLRAVHRNEIEIHDPGFGVRRLSMDTVSRHFTGVALELTPTPGFTQTPPVITMKLREALGEISGLNRLMAIVFFMALAIEVLGITIPFYMQTVVDNALVSADQSLLTTLAIGFALIIVTQVVIRLMRGWTLMAMSTSLKVQGGANLFTHLQRLPSTYFESRHLADVVSRFSSLSTIQRALTTDLIEGFLDGLFTIITLVIMLMISPDLTLIVILGAVFYAGLRIALYRPLREASLEGIIWGAKRDSHFLETLRGIRTIKLMNGQDDRRARWLNLTVETVNRDLTAEKLGLLFRAANRLMLGLLTILVVWIGATKVLDSEFSVGMLLAFVAYKSQFLGRISALIDMLTDLRMLRLHGERLADIAKTAPEPDDVRPDSDRDFEASLEFKDIRYRYSPHDPWVLDGVSFKVAQGESVAIIGPSGCGKTTLLKIMASLLRPESGDILVGDEPIGHLGLDNYRKAIGVVLQDDQMLAGSIAENISFFSTSPDRKLIEECARTAAVHDDIIAMPMGYESLIGDMGTSLSSGQKQRVLLARALYRKPKILLLDEATSHLDVDRERQVSEALSQQPLTRIIVAHRPETIRSADRVIRLRSGKIED